MREPRDAARAPAQQRRLHRAVVGNHEVLLRRVRDARQVFDVEVIAVVMRDYNEVENRERREVELPRRIDDVPASGDCGTENRIHQHASAVGFDEQGGVPGGDELWVVDWIETAAPLAWSIRILEELDPDSAQADRADIGKDDLQAMADESRQYTGAKYKGATLPGMMGQDEIRKYTEHVEKQSRPK